MVQNREKSYETEGIRIGGKGAGQGDRGELSWWSDADDPGGEWSVGPENAQDTSLFFTCVACVRDNRKEGYRFSVNVSGDTFSSRRGVDKGKGWAG